MRLLLMLVLCGILAAATNADKRDVIIVGMNKMFFFIYLFKYEVLIT